MWEIELKWESSQILSWHEVLIRHFKSLQNRATKSTRKLHHQAPSALPLKHEQGVWNYPACSAPHCFFDENWTRFILDLSEMLLTMRGWIKGSLPWSPWLLAQAWWRRACCSWPAFRWSSRTAAASASAHGSQPPRPERKEQELDIFCIILLWGKWIYSP